MHCTHRVFSLHLSAREREVAVGTPALWSSALISQQRSHSLALAMQLDRALKPRVWSRTVSERHLQNVFGLVLEKESIKKLTIIFEGR